MWHLNFLAVFKHHAGLVLRLILGYAFFAVHGLEKLRNGGDLDWGQGWVDKMSGAAPEALLYVAAWTEFMAGFALILGLLTRWATLGILAVMVYAFFEIHDGDPFKRRELAFAYGGAALALLASGPGPLSLDRLFFGKDALEPQK